MSTLSLFAPPSIAAPPRPASVPARTSFAMRDYQRRAVDGIVRCLREEKSTLLVLPTGTGKTVCLAHVIREFVPPDKRALVLAHRQELIEQNARTIHAVLGEPVGIEMGDVWADQGRTKHRVIVASKDSLHAKRRARFTPDDFALVIVDEAHHATAKTYTDVYDHFDGVPLLGVTATPDRTDEEALGQVFSSVAMVYEITDAIRDGYLVPVHAHTVFVESLNLADVHTTAGDFNVGELAAQLESEKTMYEIAASIQREAAKPENVNRRGLIFTASVRQATRLSEILNDHVAGSAQWACGETPREERALMLADHKAGAFRWLVNCALWTEGYDDPGLGFVVLARPTKSRSMFCVDEETEILTPSGWKGIDDQFDTAYAYSRGGSISISRVLARSCRDPVNNELVYGISGRHLDMWVSGEHRVLYSARHGRTKIRKTEVRLAKNLPQLSDIKIPVCGNQSATGIPLSDDEIRFIGLVMTDGTISKSTRGITITQSERHPECIEYIRRVLIGCRFKNTEVVKKLEHTNLSERRHKIHLWTISHGIPRGTQKHLTGYAQIAPWLDKCLSPRFEDATRAQLLVLLEAMNVGDGQKYKSPSINWRPKTMSICSGRRECVDRLQSLCVRRGIRCSVGTNGRGVLVMHIRSDQSEVSLPVAQKDRTAWGSRPASGRLWCIQVDTGFIICRRRGKVFVTGNSQMLGRGTRPLPGVVDGLPDPESRRAAIAASAKPYVSILDFTGVSGRHKLITPADVLGGNYSQEDVDAASTMLQDGGDVAEALEAAKQAREARKDDDEERKHVAAIVGNRHKIMALAKYMLTPADLFGGAIDYVPRERNWQRGKAPTEAQVGTLERAGFGRAEIEQLSRQECSTMIGQIIMRREAGLATLKQCKALERRGINTKGMTFAAASAAMDRLYGGRRR